MPDTDDLFPFIYFDISHECRVKLRKSDNTVVSWSPQSIPREHVLAWAQDRERDKFYVWNAWRHCVKALEKGKVEP